MKGWKENSPLTESTNNAHELMYNHVWIKISMYCIIVFIAFIFMRMLIHFNLFYIESDSAKYLLSALVQSEAAIIGIVITLTFIAVQLIFSYAPQAVSVALKKNYDMWILLFFYGLSISYGLFVLRMIPNKWDGSLGQLDFLTLWGSHVSLEYRICFAYCLGVSAFVAIAPYILNTVDFLKPSNIIKFLSHNITESKILKYIKSVKEHEENRTIPVKEDPFQPIMSIIHGSVMKSDITTLRCGLETVVSKAVDIIDLYKYSDNKDIPMYFCGHLGRAGKYVLRAEDDESAIVIIDCLKNIGISAIEMPSDEAVKTSAQYIEMIGTFAAEKKLRFVTCDAVESLDAVGEFAAQNRLEDVTSQVTDSIGNVGMYAAENKIGIAAQYAAKYLGRVGKCAAENELKDAASKSAESLGVVGNYAADNKLKYATSEAALSLGDVGKAAAEKGFEDAASQAAASLGGLGKAATEKELGDVTEYVASYLRNVGETAAKNKLDDAASQAAASLGDVGTSAAEKGLEDVTWHAASYLRNVGETAAENGLSNATSIVVQFLGAVGTAAAEKGLERAVSEAAWSLRFVGTTAAEKGFGDATEQATGSLRDIGRIVAEKGLEDATKIVVRSLGAVGTTAIEKELKSFVAAGAARFLAELTISSEEVVNSAMIQELAYQESKQEEPDQDSFQKFMKLYEQRLEELRELRTRKPN